MKNKLSPWHSADTKPVHVGVYHVRCKSYGCTTQESAWWGGKHWSPQRPDRKTAEYLHHYMAQDQNKQWRGIVK